MIFSAKTFLLFLLRILSLTTAGVEINRESIKSLKGNIPGESSKQGKEEELANVLLKILFTNFFSLLLLSSSIDSRRYWWSHWYCCWSCRWWYFLTQSDDWLPSLPSVSFTLAFHVLKLSYGFSFYRWKRNKECLLRKERNEREMTAFDSLSHLVYKMKCWVKIKSLLFSRHKR